MFTLDYYFSYIYASNYILTHDMTKNIFFLLFRLPPDSQQYTMALTSYWLRFFTSLCDTQKASNKFKWLRMWGSNGACFIRKTGFSFDVVILEILKLWFWLVEWRLIIMQSWLRHPLTYWNEGSIPLCCFQRFGPMSNLQIHFTKVQSKNNLKDKTCSQNKSTIFTSIPDNPEIKNES